MRLGACTREKEVAEALSRGHWPDACPEDLRAHVEKCRSCEDLALITQAMRGERAQTVVRAQIQPAGTVWWRAQLRRRNEALRRMDRPVIGAQIFAIVLTLMGAAVFGFLELRHVEWAMWFQELPHSLHLDSLLPGLPSTTEGSAWLVVPLLALLAVASGVIVYVASDRQ